MIYKAGLHNNKASFENKIPMLIANPEFTEEAIRISSKMNEARARFFISPASVNNCSAKEYLYDVANYETTSGIKNNVAKSLANKLNQRLRNMSPDYAKANDSYALIKKIEYDAGGLNESTIGDKLFDYGNPKTVRKGFDKKIKMVDTLLDSKDKFLNDVKYFQKIRNEQDDLLRIISQKYERNPKLLTHIKDEEGLNALNELQTKTGINFMDKAEDLAARGEMERFMPGQGGGSGSSQGAGNLVRSSIIGGAGVGSMMTGNPLPLALSLMFSPKIGAKGSVQNIGRLNNFFKSIPAATPYIAPITPALASQRRKK